MKKRTPVMLILAVVAVATVFLAGLAISWWFGARPGAPVRR